MTYPETSKKPKSAKSVDSSTGTTPPTRFADAQSYCVFPARETGFALRILDSDKAPSASGFKDTFYSQTKSLWFEIQSIQQKLKSLMASQPENIGQGKHIVLGDLQDVLITGVALHIPHLKDAVLVIGQLMDLNRHPQDPLGFRGKAETVFPFWDLPPSDSGNIRLWIFDRALIDKNKKVLHLTEKGHPGLTQMAIFKSNKLDKQTLRHCDFTHSLGRLINLYTPWAEAYFPKFQIYHPDLDMAWNEQAKDPQAKVDAEQPHHLNVFDEKGITCSEMLILPSALELICAMLKLAAVQQEIRQEKQGSSKQQEEPHQSDSDRAHYTFLFEGETLFDLHESFKRLAHFLDCDTQSTIGNWDHAPYLSAPKWAKPEHLKPADIFEAVADNLAYGIDTCGEDISSPDFSPVKKGFELNKTQACGLFEKLTECLVKQVQLEDADDTEEDRIKIEKLRSLEEQLIADKQAGPVIWVSVRAEIEKALLRQKKMKFGLFPGSPIPPVATQIQVGASRLFTSKGLTLELFRNEIQTPAYNWMISFVQAPVSTCVKVQMDVLGFNPVLNLAPGPKVPAIFNASELKINRLSVLANVLDSKPDPTKTPFVESGPYTPQAIYQTPEQAREVLELILQMSDHESTKLSLVTLSMAKKEDWLSFLATASLHAKAVLFDEQLRVH